MANFTKVLQAMAAEATGNHGQNQNNNNENTNQVASNRRTDNLEDEVARLRLACEGMWKLLAEHLGFTDEHLTTVISALDESDGQKDNRFEPNPITCTCGAKVSSNLSACQYCGLENKKQRMF